MKASKYKEFVFFSAGPVGDHVILIDFANRFFESSGIPSRIIMKHPNSFIRDFALPYHDHISYISFSGWKGRWGMVSLFFSSIFTPRIYVNVLPIIVPFYYKLFAYGIRFFTRSRFVGFNLEGSKHFPKGNGSSSFLGKGNYIPAEIDKKLFYEEANRMLSFLGFPEVGRLPHLEYVKDKKLLHEYGLQEKNYLVMHLCASHEDRTLPIDKWNRIIRKLREALPEVPFVFTGAAKDEVFIKECLKGISEKNIVLITGRASTQQLLTLHAYAKANVVVHTGNAHFINMLHVPTVTFNIKGVYFFKFYYNENGVELVATKDCTCDPFERECTLVPYQGKEYMACLINIEDDVAVHAIVSMYRS